MDGDETTYSLDCDLMHWCMRKDLYGPRQEHGVVREKDKLTQTSLPLLVAAETGDLEAAKVCMQDPDCDVNATAHRWHFGPRTALMLAAERTKSESDKHALIMRELLKHDMININQRAYGETALHRAMTQPNLAALKLLVNDERCDVNAKDYRKGKTALMYAAEQVQYDDDAWGHCIKTLMARRDLDPGMTDKERKTAFDILLRQQRFKITSFNCCDQLRKTLTLLVMKGNRNHENCVAQAISCNPLKICNLLLRSNFNPNAFISKQIDSTHSLTRSEGKETALHCAVRMNSHAKVKLLLKYKPAVTVKWRGVTPLQLAIAYNVRPEILELFSKDITKSEIAEAVQKCSMVGESIQDCIIRLGVPAWMKHFDIPIRSEMHPLSKGGTNTILCAVRKSKVTDKSRNSSQTSLHTVIQCRKDICKHSESKELTQTVLMFLKTVSNIISEHVPGLEFKPVLAGSMAEDTKVYLPNEVDVMCVLTTQLLMLERYRGLSLTDCGNHEKSLVAWILGIDNEPQPRRPSFPRHILNAGGEVLASRLAQLFYDHVEIALEKVINTGQRFGKIRLFKRSLIWCDKVSRLQLMWNGREFKNMIISVDLALCVPVDKAFVRLRDHWEFALGFEIKEHFMICKSSRLSAVSDIYPFKDSGKLSASNVELEFLNNYPINVKRGLILAKAVRIASIAKPDEDLSTAFCLAEDVHIDDLISSHMLKSCLIERYKFVYENNTLTPCDVAISIYDDLQQQLEDKYVRSWMGGPLLNCTDCNLITAAA